MKEKRSHHRINLDGRVNFQIRDADSTVFKADLLNIGHNGFAMSLMQDIHIEAGNTFEFELITPGFTHSLTGSAKVKYVHKIERYKISVFRVGLEFLDVNKDLILLLLKRHQVKVANKERARKKVTPIDFMPY